MDNRVLIVHVSDFHFKEKLSDYDKNLLNSLEKDIKERIENFDIDKSHILFVISGDLSLRGHINELNTFWSSILEITKNIGIEKEKIFSCPGNHEYNRDKENKYEKDLKQTFLDRATPKSGEEMISELLYKKENDPQKKVLMSFTEDYYKSLKNNLNRNISLPEDYAKSYVINFDSNKIPKFIITTFNSAIINFGDDPKISLGFIPSYEMEMAKNFLNKNEENTFKIAIYHHSLSSLQNVQRDRKIIDFMRENYDIALHGHLHYRDTFSIPSGPFIEIGAGAFNPPDYDKISYTLVLLDFNDAKISTFNYVYNENTLKWESEKKEEFPLGSTIKHHENLYKKLEKYYLNLENLNLTDDLKGGLFNFSHFKINESKLVFPSYRISTGNVNKNSENVLQEILFHIQNRNSVVLIGDAGAGKSLISYSLFQHLKDNKKLLLGTESSEESLYLFINLGNVKESQDILKILSDINLKLINKKIYLIFDGYDEYLSKITFNRMDDLVLPILKRHDSEYFNILLLSMRGPAYASHGNLINDFLKNLKIITLKEIILNEEDMKKFVLSIFRNDVNKISSEKFNIIINNMINFFNNNKIPKLPIFVIMLYVILSQENNETLEPKSLFEIYLRFFIDLYNRENYKFEDKKFSLNEFLKGLGYFAWRIYISERYNFINSDKNAFSKQNEFYKKVIDKSDEIDRKPPFIYSTLIEKSTCSEGGIKYNFIHEIFENFSIAISIILNLFSNPKNYGQDQIIDFFQFILTKEVTSFIKEYLTLVNNSDSNLNNIFEKYNIEMVDKETVIDRLANIILKEDNQNQLHSEKILSIYLLGRIKSPKSKEILQKIYDNYKEKYVKNNYSITEYDTLIWRNCAVSLMKLDDDKIEKDYFERLNFSTMEKYVNLKFHLEYYLDIPLSNWYIKQDETKVSIENTELEKNYENLAYLPFNKTFAYLKELIDKSIKNKIMDTYFNLPLYTLNQILELHLKYSDDIYDVSIIKIAAFLFNSLQITDLYISENKIEIHNKEITIKLIKDNEKIISEIIKKSNKDIKFIYLLLYEIMKINKEYLSNGTEKSENLFKIIQKLKEMFVESGIEAKSFEEILKLIEIIELYKLKDLLRTGWVIRGVTNGETVAEHLFSTILIFILLKYDELKTDDILKGMLTLLVHDLGESIIGDLVINDPKFKTKNTLEYNSMDYISKILNENFILDLFRDFESENKGNLSDLCKQIDKLDPIIQAYIYLTKNEVNKDNIREFFTLTEKNNLIQDKDLKDIFDILKKLIYS